MLFYAILFSDSIGPGLNALVKSNVDDLRRFRNKEFAHLSRGQLSEGDFQIAMGKVLAAFQGLGLSTVQIQDITNQNTFPTEELRDIVNKVEDLEKELQEKEKQQQGLKDQLKENEEQRKTLAQKLQENEEKRQSLAGQLQEREQQRENLVDQLRVKEEHQQGLEDQLQENEEQRKSLEYQLKENEAQRQILEDQLQIKDVERQNLVDELQQKEEQLQVLEDQLQNDTPSFCVLPPKPSHDVAGRKSEVAEITQQLEELKQADEKTLSCLYISGNPGSGKSQLAGLVAKQFFENAQNDPNTNAFVMTLNAESLDTLLESYFSFARQLKCSDYAVTNIFQSKDLKTDEKIVHLKSLINTKVTSYSSWLLVADNVKSISQVHVHLPGPANEQWAKGQLLVTTQDTKSIPLPSSFIGHISVKKGMKPGDACSLLADLSGIADSDMERKVAEALDYQPLALASAATYIKQLRQNKTTSHFGWNDYLEKVGKGQRVTTETVLAETNPSYPKSMTKATTLAVNEIVKSDKVINHMFRFLSLCAPEPLSQDVVINYILNVDEEIQDKEMIITRMQRCSLILLEEEDGCNYVGVHQVVRDVIQASMKEYRKGVRREAVSGAVTAFSQFIDDSLPEDQWLSIDTVTQTKCVAPHLKCLITKAEKLISKENIPRIIKTVPDMLKLGQTCEHHCDLNSAKRYYEYSLAIIVEKNGPEHVNAAAIYDYLGVVCYNLGDFEEAKKFHHHALNIKLKNLGPVHVELAASYNNLGYVYQELGDFEQAKKFHHRALNIKLKLLGPEHVEVAASYNSLGSVYEELGDFELAKKFHHCALNIKLKLLGPEFVETSTSYSNLGSVYQKLSDFEQAKEFHHLALNIYLEKLGPDHVEVATSYSNLGSVYQMLSHFEQAKEFHHQALNIYLEKLGPDHVNVATIYNNLGFVYQQLGDFELAKEFHHQALNIRLKKLGPDHVEVATSYSHLGFVFQQLGDFEQAKEFHHQALNIDLKKPGPDHVHVATSYGHLGSVYQQLGDFEQAKEFHRRASNIRKKQLEPAHVNVSNAFENMVTVEQASVELPPLSESNNPSGVMEHKQQRHVRSKRCRIL